ncbi:hypothetical protein BDZ91DRAFT_651512 [Kalaharituber pfeilii]|nr:hypothetical protein BDZ91DRAFT_651512 [Kalaharituber pfeilii]
MEYVLHVNGILWPYFEVEPRKYRFRILIMMQASDSGFMAVLVPSDSILVAMAEYYEVIVDFTNYTGQMVHFRNQRNFSKNEDYPMTDWVMQFIVGENTTDVSGNEPLRAELIKIDYLVSTNQVNRHFKFDFVNHAWMINEVVFKDKARRIQAAPERGSVEVWQLESTNGTVSRVHPVHIHLIDIKILRGIPMYIAICCILHVKEKGVTWIPSIQDTVFLQEGVSTVIARFTPWPGQYM